MNETGVVFPVTGLLVPKGMCIGRRFYFRRTYQQHVRMYPSSSSSSSSPREKFFFYIPILFLNLINFFLWDLQCSLMTQNSTRTRQQINETVPEKFANIFVQNSMKFYIY